MVKERRTYDRMFKLNAVQLYCKRGDNTRIEQELKIPRSLLSKWRKQYLKFGTESFCGKGNGYLKLNSEQLKLNELERKAERSEFNYEILEKGRHSFLQGKIMIFKFILNNEKIYSTRKMCRTLGVGTLGYHRWKNQFISEKQSQINLLKEEINSIFIKSKQRHGSSKIALELQKRGYKISRITVSRYMINLGLHAKSNRKFVVTTDSKHNYYIAPNILDRKFTVKRPCSVWVSDITYLQTTKGFLYLTIILDLFDRKIIGWSLSSGLATELTTIPAWEMAVSNREITSELIFHSDKGVQYANKRFTNLLDSYLIVKRSMSGTGDSIDNAVAESFFSTLKKELIYVNKLFTPKEMKAEIFDFIETWYNKKRMHSALNFKTIAEFELTNKI